MMSLKNYIHSILFFSVLSLTHSHAAVIATLEGSGPVLPLDISGVNLPLGYGSPAPTTFSGVYNFETNSNLATRTSSFLPNTIRYEFDNQSLNSTLSLGTFNYSYNDIYVELNDDVEVLSGSVFGLIDTGTYDVFTVGAYSPGAVFSPTGQLQTGIEFRLSYYTNTNYFSGLIDIPIELQCLMDDVAFLTVSESDDFTINRFAIGQADLDTLSLHTVVPLPAAIWMLFSGLIGLRLISSKKSQPLQH